MNTDKAVADAVKEIMGWLRSGGDAVVAHAPDIARELLARDLMLAYLGLGIAVALSICVGVFWYGTRDWKDCVGDAHVPRALLAGLVSIFVVVGIMINVDTILRIKYAPKLYVVEHIAKLAK
jgi:hypothetical protein